MAGNGDEILKVSVIFRAEQRLIASKIKVCVYKIYLLCIIILYI